MAADSFRFGDFVLDPGDRQLRRGAEPVELNARYLDALVLLVREQGKLVSKDRFHDEVWRGVPVTDEALTQCVKTLRRQLGDDAGNPRFIETVPKHGYRFIAPVDAADGETGVPPLLAPEPPPATLGALWRNWPERVLTATGGMIGGGQAGLVGGLFYGFAGASQPLQPGTGAASVLLVLMCLTIIVALIGGAGVSFGVALGGFGTRLGILGGALGGLVIGAVAKLIGLDAFNLLFGRAPSDMTGAVEGLILGSAVGLGAWAAGRGPRPFALRRGVLLAALAGAVAGILIVLTGGRLMAGSLSLLAGQFPQSRLRLDPIGAWLGESGFGPISQAVTAALEGALFSACVVGAMILARRTLGAVTPSSS